MGYECQIYKTLAGNGRGKTLLFHDIRTSINPKHTKFSYLCSYLKILFLPKWYLFPEQVTYGLLFELWVLNLNEKKEKKMKNSAHHSPIHL